MDVLIIRCVSERNPELWILMTFLLILWFDILKLVKECTFPGISAELELNKWKSPWKHQNQIPEHVILFHLLLDLHLLSFRMLIRHEKALVKGCYGVFMLEHRYNYLNYQFSWCLSLQGKVDNNRQLSCLLFSDFILLCDFIISYGKEDHLFVVLQES